MTLKRRRLLAALAACGFLFVVDEHTVGPQSQSSGGVELYSQARGPVRRITTQLPGWDRPQTITVRETDQFYVYQGDILIPKSAAGSASSGASHSLSAEPSAIVIVSTPTNRQELVVREARRFRWPNGILLYAITGDWGTNNAMMRQRIRDAMAHIEQHTMIRFHEITEQDGTDVVSIVNSDGCAAHVGRWGGRQEVQLGLCSTGAIIHEFLHALGVYHEHTRTDRDQFITINKDNIAANELDNFDVNFGIMRDL